MESHIGKLPVEILHDILRRTRNRCTRSELCRFTELLTCCSLWYDVAKPLQWQDVVLRNRDLPYFLANATDANLTMVRSLTIYLSPVAHDDQKDKFKTKPLAELLFDQEPGATWSHLDQLRRIMPIMSKLTTFSFSVPHSSIDMPFDVETQCWLRYSSLDALLQSLPKSCTSIEIDTSSQKDRAVKHHLCHTLRHILPRMKHVRLSLGMLCYSLFESKKGIPESMPLLETLIVNLHCSSPRNSFLGIVSTNHRPDNCDPAIYVGYEARWPLRNPPVQQELFIAMLDSAIRAGA